MTKTDFKRDKYSKKRGGYSRWLLVLCEHCKNPLVLYQKDGPGILKRLYFDRIVAPTHLVDLQNQSYAASDNLVCNKCDRIVGVPIIFEKEKRPAYRLFVGAVEKKVVKNTSEIGW